MANIEKGTLVLFEKPEDLLAGIKNLRSKGFSKLEAYSPFPVHGMEAALGLKRSKIPYVTLACGLTGAFLAMLLQYWTSAVDWPIIVGGKPFFSWPAFIPITFEGAVLIGGVMTFVALLITLGLPCFSKPVLDSRLTDNLFGLFVGGDDPRFSEAEIKSLLKECHVKEIKKIG